MATAAETEASSTDASWESRGGGGDDGMKPAFPELESSPQNGGGGGFSSTAELGGGAGPEETAAAEASRSHSHELPQHTSEAAALPKGAEEPERPVRRSFQIPRKSREKKGGASPFFPTPSLSLFSPLHLFIRSSLSSLPTPIRDT